MKSKSCPVCGTPMKKNGFTSSGKQRWRCRGCGMSRAHSKDNTSIRLKEFLSWLFSKDTQSSMPGSGRTFRRRTKEFWDIWPMPEVVDEIHRVVYVDGIYLKRNLVVLIACSDQYVLGWYIARGETRRAWEALLEKIAPPEVVVTDSGSGFASAVKHLWPQTRIQQCLFHVYKQTQRYTTSKPKLLAGQELYQLAIELMHLDTLYQAQWWVEQYFNWCEFWNDFLSEKSYIDGKYQHTHERLVKAKNSISRLINKGNLFTYLDPELTRERSLPRTNNRIEGGVNAQLRNLLREHRGMRDIRRIKAVFWWCYMHTECPKSAQEIIRSMPTDKDIDLLYEMYTSNPKEYDKPQWGDGVVWEEFHHKASYSRFID